MPNRIEREVIAVLEQLARQRHKGDCRLVRVELRGPDGAMLEVLDFTPNRVEYPSIALASLPSAQCGADE